jgi:hypothetical protein
MVSLMSHSPDHHHLNESDTEELESTLASFLKLDSFDHLVVSPVCFCELQEECRG